MKIAFFVAAALVAYTTAVFPCFMILRGRFRKRPVHGRAFTPLVSVVIAARDESASIGAKIESILAADYPDDRREIIVVSDGSTDDTESVVRRYAMYGVRLISLPARGKAEAVRAGVESSNGQIVVFTDANGVLDRAALRNIVWPFGDPHVGGVAGDQRYTSTSRGLGTGEHRYWTFDRLLKRAEGRSGDVVAATGGFYAIRRELFEPIPPGVNDDLFTSMGVVQKRRRLVFASDAVAYEPLAPSSRAEVQRKIRIMTRGMRTVFTKRSLLNPLRYGFYSIELLSHKVLRWFLVVPLLILAVTGTLLWNEGWVFRVVSAPLVAAYVVGVLGILLSRNRVGQHPLLSFPAYFCAMNVGALVAAWNLITGRSIEAWRPGRVIGGLTVEAPSAPRGRASTERGWRVGVVALSIALGLALAAAAQPTIVAALVVIACTGVILALRPDVSRLVAFGLLFSDASFVAVRFGGPARLAALGVIAALGIPLLYDLVVRRERVELSPALPFLVAYVLVQALSALVATRAVASGQVLGVGGNAGSASVVRFTVEGLALYVVVSNVVRTREMLRRSILVMLGVAAVLSALAFTNTLRGNYQNDYIGFVTAERIERGTQTIGEDSISRWETKYGGRRHAGPLRGRPNRWGVALLPLVPIGWVLAGQAEGRRKRILIGGAFVLTLGGLVFTFSRGTFLGLAACVGVMVLFKSVKVRHVLAALALGLAFIALVPAVGGRVLSLRGIAGVLLEDPDADPDASIRGRYTTSVAAIFMFLDHPIVGVGPGNYPVWYREYANEFPVLVHPNDRRPHNLYLGTASETGILGLLTLGAVCFVTLRELLRARRRARDPADQRLAAAFFVAIVGLLVNMLTLHAAYIRYFWLYMALAATAARILGQKTPDEAVPLPTGRAVRVPAHR